MPAWKLMIGLQLLVTAISMLAILVYMYKPRRDE